jgi:hypothetical protein
MPHFRTPTQASALNINLAAICADLGIHYIDPCGEVEDVISSIETSSKLIAEAMHGAIVADALRVPWVPVQLSDRILNLKWIDWCSSLRLEYRPRRFAGIPSTHHSAGDLRTKLTAFLQHAANAQPVLSEGRIRDDSIARLTEKLEALKAGRDAGCIQGSAQFVPDPEVLSEVPWLYKMQTALKELSEVIPVGATFILVDEERWGGGQVLAGRRTLPFLEREGQYWGLPPNGEVAVGEIERLRENGAEYIVFMQPSFWMLEYYPEIYDHLSRYPLVERNGNFVLFALSDRALSRDHTDP